MTYPSASRSNLYRLAAAQDETHTRRSDHTRHSDQKRKRDGHDHGDIEADTEAESGWRAHRRQSKRQQSSNTNTGQDLTNTRQKGEEGRQAKRSTTAHAYHQDGLNEPESKDRPTGPKSKSGQWTEQDLRSIISKATESPFPGASAIHPTALVIANSIVVPSVPVDVFNKLQSLLPSIPATLTWKLEFHHFISSTRRTRGTRGRIVVTMPSRVHEAFIPFSNDIADQLYDAAFLPLRYGKKAIMQSGSTELKSHVQGLVPDAGIAFFKTSNTFLVLEVAYSQTEASAKVKAQRYNLDTDGKITFVVVVVTKMPRKTPPLPQQRSELDKEELDPDHDTVHVHVYKSIRQPPDILTGEHVVNKVQVFPGPAPSQTFTIAWSDINCGDWSVFREGARLPPDMPEPSCDINFNSLVSIARGLSSQPEDPREGTPLFVPDLSNPVATPMRKTKYVESSSPAPVLSSGGTVSSNEGRMLDPDWQPSLGSDGSSDSFDSSR